MDALLKFGQVAWNPIGAVSDRRHDGSLTIGKVMVPFMAAVVGCNLVAYKAQNYLLECLRHKGANVEQDVPAYASEFSIRIMAHLGVLVPVALIALLPSGLFRPVGKAATISAVFIVAAGWAFYGSVMSILVYWVSGNLILVDLAFGQFVLGISLLATMAIMPLLTAWFWFGSLVGELDLSLASVFVITVTGLVGLGGLVVLTVIYANALFG
ncbi:MAG: hypothetical protein ACYTGZ_13685 [Planctomycetota bacterium]|jgi:hypothetical protein